MIKFNEQEKHHAETVLSELFRRRFFLDKDGTYSETFATFPVIVEQQDELLRTYRRAEEAATGIIQGCETALGIEAPEISKDSKLVRASLYGSGFDVMGIFPLSFFMGEFDEATLGDELTSYFREDRGDEDLSPKEKQQISSNAENMRDKILGQFKEISAQEGFERLSVVLMKSRFRLGSYGPELAEGRLDWIKKYPTFLAYVFHKVSKTHRFVDHNYVLFDTKRKSHPVLQHWRDKEPSISYGVDIGYDCSVYFAAIL